jgi:ubiquinol-cytochrome c reductase cytochrome b subunit
LWIFAALALLPAESEDYIMILAPLVIGITLVALPFFFNKRERHPRRRPWAVGVVIIVVVMVGTLWRTGVNAPWSPDFEAEQLPIEVIPAGDQRVAQGAQIFYNEGCIYCHAYAEQGGLRGPNLTNVSERLSAEQITIAILAGREAQGMPAYAGTLTVEEVQALVAFFQAEAQTTAVR